MDGYPSPLIKALHEGPKYRPTSHRTQRPQGAARLPAHDWWDIALGVEQGVLSGDPNGLYQHRQSRRDVFSLLMRHIQDLLPRNGIHSTSDFTHPALEATFQALWAKGTRPLDNPASYSAQKALQVLLLNGMPHAFELLHTSLPDEQKEQFAGTLNQAPLELNRVHTWGHEHLTLLQKLARAGQGRILQYLVKQGWVGQEQINTHLLGHVAQHGATLGVLAHLGLDPLITCEKGWQAAETWPRSVARASSQMGLRKAWNKHFGNLAGAKTVSELAALSLQTNATCAPAKLFDLDCQQAGVDPTGRLPDGRTVAAMVAYNLRAHHEHGALFKEVELAELCRRFAHTDWTALHPCGVSEGFYFALCVMREQDKMGDRRAWRMIAEQAWLSCPERELGFYDALAPLHKMKEALDIPGVKDDSAFETLFKRYWELVDHHHEKRDAYLQDMARPDPHDGEARSLLMRRGLVDFWSQQLRTTFAMTQERMEHTVAKSPHPESWLVFPLLTLSHGLNPVDMEKEPRDADGISESTNDNRLNAFRAACNSGARPPAQWLNALPLDRLQTLQTRAPHFYEQLFQSWLLAASLPQSCARAQTRTRL